MNNKTGAGQSREGNFKPGKLNDRQRYYIRMAGTMLNGRPMPFCESSIPESGMASYRDLLQRGLMKKKSLGLAELSPDGWKVARAVLRMGGYHGAAAEIDKWIEANG